MAGYAHGFELLGLLAHYTDEERREMENTLATQQDVIASLESEMAIAREALHSLVQRRNHAHQLLLSSSAPSPAVERSIRETIQENESILETLHSSIAKAQAELDQLLSETEKVSDPMFDSFCDTKNDSLEVEVNRCREHLEDLMQRQRETEDTLEAHRTKLCPFLKLPTEILGEIFKHCLPSSCVPPSPDSAPLLLLNVCSSWRNAAFSIPALWSSISIEVRGEKFTPSLSLAKAWLERSNSYPLSLRIVQTGQSSDYGASTAVSPLSTVLDIYIPHYARWRKLYLTYRDSYGTQTGFSSLPSDAKFPLLEKLHLERGAWMEQEDIRRISSMMSSAPRLRSVRWMSQKPYTSLMLPWRQLVHFTLGHIIPMRAAFEILSESPLLEKAEFSLILPVNPPVVDDEDDFKVLQHVNLHRLTVHTAGSLGLMLDRLLLPSLKAICIEAIHGIFPAPIQHQQDGVWPQEQFMSFISRSRCSLELLGFSEINISSQQLIECLRHVSSSLTTLQLSNDQIRGYYMTDDVLKLMTYSATSHWDENDDAASEELLCPNLHVLKLWGCISSSDGTFARMLESRWRPRGKSCPVRQLNSAFIGMHIDPPHPEDHARIKKMNEWRMGLTVINLSK